MDFVRALPRGHVRGPGPRTWLVSFVVALAALSGSATLLLLNVTTVLLEDPAIISPVKVLDSLPPIVHRASPLEDTAEPAVAAAAAAMPATTPFTLPPIAQVIDFTAESDPLLEAALLDAHDSQGGGLSLALVRLDDGAAASINGDDVWYSASLFKLALLYEVEKQIDAGIINLDDPLVLTAGDLAEDLGTAWDLSFDESGAISVEDALDAMVTHSDNSTAVAFLRLVGSSNVDATLAGLGLTNTYLSTEELPTTARDMALLMHALYTGKGLSPESAEHARNLLLDQEWRSGIPSGIEGEVTVGNKTGNWAGATHDVAFIAREDATYVLAILSNRDWGWETIANATWHVFNTLDSDTR